MSGWHQCCWRGNNCTSRTASAITRARSHEHKSDNEDDVFREFSITCVFSYNGEWSTVVPLNVCSRSQNKVIVRDKLNVLPIPVLKNDDDLSDCHLWRNDTVPCVKECTSPDVISSVRIQQHPHLSLHHGRTGTHSNMKKWYLHVHFIH